MKLSALLLLACALGFVAGRLTARREPIPDLRPELDALSARVDDLASRRCVQAEKLDVAIYCTERLARAPVPKER